MSVGTDVLQPAEAIEAEPDKPGTDGATDELRRRGTQSTRADSSHTEMITVIEPTSGWRLVNLRELYDYRDLYRLLTWRTIKARYAQSALGIGWAVVQPVFQVLVFTIVFGHIAGLKGQGGNQYSLFVFVGLIAWSYFSSAVTSGTDSLVSNKNMISKVYFPRLVMPLSAVTSKLVDFTISLSVLITLMIAWYHRVPSWNVVWLPLLIVLMVSAAAGVSIWLTALAIQYRDVKHGLTFGIQLLMYASPVIYATERLPERFDLGRLSDQLAGIVVPLRLVYAANPMVGVIEGFRAAFLGSAPMPWDLLAMGALSTLVTAVTGLLYFRSRERLFADVA